MAQQVTIPDARLCVGLSIEADLAKLRDEQQRVATRLRELRRLVDGYNTARTQAHRADVEASALALREGRPDPGPVGVAKLDADLASWRQEQQVLLRARDMVTQDVQQLLRDHAPDLGAELEARRSEASVRRIKAIAAARTAIEEYALASRLLGWAAARGEAQVSAGGLPWLRLAGYDAIDAGRMLAALERMADDDDPQPEPATPPVAPPSTRRKAPAVVTS
jgi:hypothetical protein